MFQRWGGHVFCMDADVFYMDVYASKMDVHVINMEADVIFIGSYASYMVCPILGRMAFISSILSDWS
jgi:hypothetical protein